MSTPTDIIPWSEGTCTLLRVGEMYGVYESINLHVYLYPHLSSLLLLYTFTEQTDLME